MISSLQTLLELKFTTIIETFQDKIGAGAPNYRRDFAKFIKLFFHLLRIYTNFSCEGEESSSSVQIFL